MFSSKEHLVQRLLCVDSRLKTMDLELKCLMERNYFIALLFGMLKGWKVTADQVLRGGIFRRISGDSSVS